MMLKIIMFWNSANIGREVCKVEVRLGMILKGFHENLKLVMCKTLAHVRIRTTHAETYYNNRFRLRTVSAACFVMTVKFNILSFTFNCTYMDLLSRLYPFNVGGKWFHILRKLTPHLSFINEFSHILVFGIFE